MKEIIIFLLICFCLDLIINIFTIDDTDKGYWKRSGMALYTDHKTGIQYLKAGWFGGITPRLDKDGNIMRSYK